MTIGEDKVVHLDDRRGDRDRLIQQVLTQHGADLRRFLRMRLALHEDREDLTQELFVRLARVPNLAESLAAKSGSTRSYLFSILNNLILDLQRYQRRRGGRHESYDDELVITEVFAPEKVVSSQQMLEKSMQILKRLDERYRTALVLHRFKHMNQQDIADEMGVSISSVERYIAAALKALREGLKDGE